MIPEIVWLVLLVVFLVVEAATVGLVSLWFAAGAVGGLVTALLGGGIWMQIGVFILISAAALMVMRPLIQRYVSPKMVATNSDRIIGMEGVVTERIENLKAMGQIRVGGAIWSARSAGDVPVEKGTLVRVLRIEGVKVYVEPVPAAVSQQ